MKKVTSLLVLASLISAALLSVHSASAQSQGSSVTISPFLREIRFSADEETKEFSVEITNDTKIYQTFNLTVLDFGTLNESGGIVFAGSDASSLVKKYGLASWLKLEKSSLSLEPDQTTQIKATIYNDSTMTPGGHYAAILASVDNPGGESTGNDININQQLSSLILATKVGGEKYDLKLSGISPNGNWLKLPESVELKFSNPGNVHITPRGVVSLKTIDGKVISRGVINSESSYIFPETSRNITVDLSAIKDKDIWPTMYKLQVDYRYDGVEQFAQKDQFVYFFNAPSLALLTVLLIVSLILVKRYISRKNSR